MGAILTLLHKNLVSVAPAASWEMKDRHRDSLHLFQLDLLMQHFEENIFTAVVPV